MVVVRSTSTRAVLSAASPKLGKTPALGCALQGGAVRFMRISPTHVGMDQHPARCRKTCSVFPTHVGIPSLEGVSVPGLT